MRKNLFFTQQQFRLLSAFCLIVLSICGVSLRKQIVQTNSSKLKKLSIANNTKNSANLKSVVLEDAFVSKPAAGITQADASASSASGDYISDFAADGLYTWPESKTAIRVYFAPANGIPGYDPSSPRVLASCFDEWCAASEGRLNWKRVSSAQDADIKVRWTEQVTERAEGTEAGRTRTYARLNTVTNRGTIDGADMILLTRLPERTFSAAETKKAYLHEVGHAFGIVGHSHDRHDAMYFALSTAQTGHLDDRDRATLDRLYGIGGADIAGRIKAGSAHGA